MLTTALLWMWILSSPVDSTRAAEARSTDTSVKWCDCQLLDRSDEGGHSKRKCPAYGGNSIRNHDPDHGGSLDLFRGDQRVSNKPPIQIHRGDVTGKIVEWRSRRRDPKRPYAFMFRMYSGGPPESCRSRAGELQVVRLKGERASIIGTTASNEEASRGRALRELAAHGPAPGTGSANHSL